MISNIKMPFISICSAEWIIRIKEAFMTKTMQFGSFASLSEVDKDLKKNKPETEDDNMSLILKVYDGLNNLYEKLNRLNYILERKKLEKNIHSGAD